MHKAHSRHFGFTIVELLVVIVVIGILAGITVVSYAGIRQRAVSSSLQSDLTNAVKKLKMYSVENGTYPQSLDANNCPVGPADSRYCLKASPGNTLSYCPVSPYSTFGLKSTNANGTVYTVTDGNSPVQSGSSSMIFSSGGTITSSGCYRTHTFTPGTYNLTVGASGEISVVINGGGGGGGVYSGGAGGEYSSLTYNGVTYVAAGGGGGGGGIDEGTCCGPTGGAGSGIGGGAGGAGTNGITGAVYTGGAGGGAPYTMTLVSGAGGAGAAGGGDAMYFYGGGPGGAGGKLFGTMTVRTGQSLTITVGAGGISANNTSILRKGTDGSVIVNYLY